MTLRDACRGRAWVSFSSRYPALSCEAGEAGGWLQQHDQDPSSGALALRPAGCFGFPQTRHRGSPSHRAPPGDLLIQCVL